MKRSSPMGKTDRTAAKVRLGQKLREWTKMSDEQLLAEVKKEIPVVTQATRDECLNSLVMLWVERLFNTY